MNAERKIGGKALLEKRGREWFVKLGKKSQRERRKKEAARQNKLLLRRERDKARREAARA